MNKLLLRFDEARTVRQFAQYCANLEVASFCNWGARGRALGRLDAENRMR